MIFPAAQDTEL